MKRPSARCLLVASDFADAALLGGQIRAKGIADVTMASSLLAAREAIQASAYDVVMTAARLRDGDGLSLLRSPLRREEVVYVLLGPDLGKQGILQALRCGAADVFEPPFDGTYICARLCEVLQRQRQQRRAARRHVRLRELSMRIIKDRRDVRRKVDIVCRDLVGAYRALAEKVVARDDRLMS